MQYKKVAEIKEEIAAINAGVNLIVKETAEALRRLKDSGKLRYVRLK